MTIASLFVAIFYFQSTNGYIYVPTPMSFGAAQAYCVNNYDSNLATVITPNNMTTANSQILNPGETWIGLYSIRTEGWWLFRNGDECADTTSGACIHFWGTPKGVPLCIPDHHGYECAYYVPDQSNNGLVYNDLDCLNEQPFLCQQDNSNPPPPVPDITYIGNCPCLDVTIGQCSNNVMTITCTETDLYFDETTDAIRSCIDIPSSTIPNGITVNDVILSTSFQHTWVGDIQSFLQKDAKQVALFGDSAAMGCCGCSENDVNVVLSDGAPLAASDGTLCDNINGFGIGGHRRSVDSLSTFDGDKANGRWIMYVYDHIGADHGIFGKWSLTLTLSQCPAVTKTCNVQNAQKIDCGHVGIDQTGCLDKGCCWYEIDNNPDNYPWCYDKGGSGGGNNTKTCNVQNAQKIDCGYVGIDQTGCLDKGCCWYGIDNNPHNYPWCYYKGG